MTVISEVLFGSQVSGGSDHQSDRDLLVVCESRSKNKIIKMYGHLGYSVSVYTPIQLEYMKLSGSLFLQHLKHESVVISDGEKYFEKFIKKCQFIPPTTIELSLSKKSLESAFRCPVLERSSCWLADYIFVLTRDYFIKYFAANGKVVFNVKELACEIENEFSLKKEEIELFFLLREFKASYRRGVNEGSVAVAVVASWQVIMLKVLNISTVHKVNISEYLFHRGACGFESGYSFLRYIESLRIIFPTIRCADQYEKKIQKYIINPNHYSSTSSKRRIFLVNYLKDFRCRAEESMNLYEKHFALAAPQLKEINEIYQLRTFRD